MPNDLPTADVSLEETPIQEVAREKLGLRLRDCPTLYRETAEAATDTDLPFWSVLLLSGAIATLGLALNATAVVIGAMLVAPLLGPLLGLSLALAVGDGRLALQTALTILLGACGVIALAALLTVMLPFQDVTAEIAARTRPTTLDLAIAVFSGLAGAVVTVSREHRLSASIPGVAIAVALIPPLSVAGFAIGTGRWEMVAGPLLLFGANLGGIVLSGMAAFLLVGMQRSDVVETARRWHEKADLDGLAGWIGRTPYLRRSSVFSTPAARVALVLAFVAAVSIPLSSSLQQVVRETRAGQAARSAEDAIEATGTASVLSRDVTVGDADVQVQMRVATTQWIGDDERAEVEKTASAVAGETVRLSLEQLIASDGDLASFAAKLPDQMAPTAPSAPAPPEAPTATLQRLRGEVVDVLDRLALPDSVRVIGADVSLGPGPTALRIAYASPDRLSRDAEAILARQTAAALQIDPVTVTTETVSTRPLPFTPDSTATVRLATLLQRYALLRLVIVADSADALSARQQLVAAGAPASRVQMRRGTPARVQVAVDEPASAGE